MDYKILISDRSLVPIEEIHGKVGNLNWVYDRNGGCGAFSFDCPIRFLEDVSLGLDYNLKVYRRNRSTNAYDLWYQGLIKNKNYRMDGNGELITIRGDGYHDQLNDIYVDSNYTSKTIEYIVKDVLDNDITPNTNITYDAGDIEATGFTIDSIKFNTKAQNVFSTLADITGTREWGVDRNRKFFFKARSSSINHRYTVPGKVFEYNEDDTSQEIINRMLVIGGDISGTPFTRVGNHTKSQAKWRRRDAVYNNAAIVTNDVADQLIQAYFAEFSDASIRARCKLLDEVLIENTTPIGLFELIPAMATYGTKRYQTGLYSGRISLQTNKINYSIDDLDNLKIELQLGQLRPDVSENIGRLKYELDQLASRGLG